MMAPIALSIQLLLDMARALVATAGSGTIAATSTATNDGCGNFDHSAIYCGYCPPTDSLFGNPILLEIFLMSGDYYWICRRQQKYLTSIQT